MVVEAVGVGGTVVAAAGLVAAGVAVVGWFVGIVEPAVVDAAGAGTSGDVETGCVLAGPADGVVVTSAKLDEAMRVAIAVAEEVAGVEVPAEQEPSATAAT